MSREDLSLQSASCEASTSTHDSTTSYGSSYTEEDHRRLLFGLMRSGITPQVELALRMIDNATGSRSTTSRSHPPSTSASTSSRRYDDEDDEDEDSYVDSADEYTDDEEEEDERHYTLSGDGEEENSPALTTKPLRVVAPSPTNRHTNNTTSGNHERGMGWAWAYSKSDDQQQNGGGQPYVERWLADVHGRSEVVV